MVCTDAHGNRDFCVDGENCLMPEARPRCGRRDIGRLLADPALRSRLGQAGIATAGTYAWGPRIDALERSCSRSRDPKGPQPSTDAVPGPRRR